MSYFQIDRFMGEFPDGFQRTNQYRCLIDVGAVGNGILRAKYPKGADLLAQGLICEGTRTPSRSFDTVNMELYGYQEKYPVFTTYTDLECSFLMPLVTDGHGGASNQIAQLMNEWQNLIQRRVDTAYNDDSMVLQFPDDYRLKRGMTLELLNPLNGKRNDGGIGIRLGTSLPYIPPIDILNKVLRNKLSPPEDTYLSPPTLRYHFFNIYPITVESSPVGWQATNEIQRVSVAFAYSYWVSS
jgi:hypothetical protein